MKGGSSFIKAAIIFCMLIFLLSTAIYGQNDASDSLTTKIKAKKHTQHKLYAGAKLGLVYILGLEMNYILETKEINRLYLAVAIQSSVVVNSANAGGGVFLGRTGIGVGCRYHHLLWFEDEGQSKIRPGYGPELVYNKTIGTKYIINLHAGCVISKGSYFPDVSFGVFLPLH